MRGKRDTLCKAAESKPVLKGQVAVTAMLCRQMSRPGAQQRGWKCRLQSPEHIREQDFISGAEVACTLICPESSVDSQCVPNSVQELRKLNLWPQGS